jgi:hypothetical protein
LQREQTAQVAVEPLCPQVGVGFRRDQLPTVIALLQKIPVPQAAKYLSS